MSAKTGEINVNEFYQEFTEFVNRMEREAQENTEFRNAMRLVIERNTMAIEAINKTIANAFPGGDAVAHRIEHEAMLRTKKAEEDFWRNLKLDLAKKGIWAVLIFFVVSGLFAVGVWEKIKGLFH